MGSRTSTQLTKVAYTPEKLLLRGIDSPARMIVDVCVSIWLERELEVVALSG